MIKRSALTDDECDYADELTRLLLLTDSDATIVRYIPRIVAERMLDNLLLGVVEGAENRPDAAWLVTRILTHIKPPANRCVKGS